MKALSPITIVLVLILSGSCKIGRTLNDVNRVAGDISRVADQVDAVSAMVVPADSLSMALISGVLSELAHADTEVKMDSITARINRILTVYLNRTLADLDPGPVGEKLVRGALDPVLEAETERRIKEILSSLSRQLSLEMTALIRDITSPANQQRLNSMMASLLSEGQSDLVSAFINRSIQGIRFDSLGQSIADDLLAANVKPELEELTRTAVRAIFDEIQKDENAKGLFGDIKNILFLGLGLLGAVLGLLFWWNRRKTVQLNKMLVHAIEDLDDTTGRDVKKVVERKARNQGLLKDLDAVLEREHLLSRKGASQPGTT